MRYYFLNKDKKLLEFELREALGGYEAVEIQRFSNVLPPSFVDINSWIMNRNFAKHKEHFKKWLSEWGIDSTKGFIEITHCLGLNDTLWVKPVDSNLQWGEVNLYDNQFDDIAKHTAFETGLQGLQLSSTSPEFTADGSFKKCWSKEGSNIYLYKQADSGASNVGLEPYAEYLSSTISKMLSPRTCEYDLVIFKGKLCSKCELFTSNDIGYMPFSNFIDLNIIQTMNTVLKRCDELGFYQEAIDMFMIDAIVFNNDRHLNNFGFLVNNDTFEVVDFAPYFDFNRSMLTHATIKEFDSINEYIHSIRQSIDDLEFRKIATELLPKASFKLPHEIELPKHPLYNMERDRMELLQKVLNQHLCNIKSENDFYEINNKTPKRIKHSSRH